MRIRQLVTSSLAGLVVLAALTGVAGAVDPLPDLDRIRLEVTGDMAVVFDYDVDHCLADEWNIPDLATRAFRDADGMVHQPLAHYRTYDMVGASLDTVEPVCDAPVFSSDEHADPSQYRDQEWLASPFTEDGTTVYALVHNEYQGNLHGCTTPDPEQFGDYEACLDVSQTLAVSTDGGQSYAHAVAPPGHMIATDPVTHSNTTGPNGPRQPSNIIKGTDGWYYAAFQRIDDDDANDQYVCLMRTMDLSDPGSWRYLAADQTFTGEFRDPYTEAGGTECSPLDRDDVGHGMSESLRYHPELEAYVLTGMSGDNIGEGGAAVWGIFYSLSRDLKDWTHRRLLMEMPLPWTVEDSGTDLSYLYPSLMDPSSPDRNFNTTDDNAFIYVTRHNAGQASPDRDLVRMSVEFSVLPGPDPTEDPSDPATEPPAGVHRLAGSGRYDTAAAVALDRFHPADVDTVYLATGRDFPDALAGGPLAAQRGAPILLVPPTALPSAVADALGTLGPGTVIALGGTSVLPENILADAAAAAGGAATDRIAGNNRYETAAAIAAAMDTSASSSAYIATGRNFPDALAGGPATGGAPILLVSSAGLPAATASRLSTLGPDRVIALGGESAVPASTLQAAARAAGSGTTTSRLAGPERYATSTTIAGELGDVDTVYVAVGTNFPDALAAGSAAASEGAPIVLTISNRLPTVTRNYLDALTGLRRIVVLGGAGAINDAVASELDGLRD